MREERDDTILSDTHDTVADTAPVRGRAQPGEQSSFAFGRALPPQSPPVTDIHLLEFRPPEVPSGGVARYPARIGLVVTEIPEFDAAWRVRERRPRVMDAERITAHQLDGRRSWHRRAVASVVAVSFCALVGGVLGLWELARL